jgi:hypothetical protein
LAVVLGTKFSGHCAEELFKAFQFSGFIILITFPLALCPVVIFAISKIYSMKINSVRDI